MKEFSSSFFEKKIKEIEEKSSELKKELVGIQQLSLARGEGVRKSIKDFRKISEIIDSIDFEEIFLNIKIERKIVNYFEKGEE